MRGPMRKGAAVLGAVVLAAGGLAVAAEVAASRDGARLAATAPIEPEGWIEIRRPIPLYHLAGGDFGKLPATYRARRHRPEGTREDLLSFGEIGGPKGFLRVSLARQGAATPERADAGIAADLSRLAALDDLSLERIEPAPPLATRFGPVEAVDLLAGNRGPAVPCRGFRSVPDREAVLRVAGLACGPHGRPVTNDALACAIDRIDLASAGDDGPLRTVFVAAERRPRADCSPPAGPSVLALTARRPGWLDAAGDLPSLRSILDIGAPIR